MSLTGISFTRKSESIPYMVAMMRMPQSPCHSLCLTTKRKRMTLPLSLCSQGATSLTHRASAHIVYSSSLNVFPMMTPPLK